MSSQAKWAAGLVASGLVVLLLLFSATCHINERWSDSDAFYRHAIRAAPNKRRVYCNYASHLGRVGRYQEAIEVVESTPGSSIACFMSATLASVRLNRTNAALLYAERAVDLEPDCRHCLYLAAFLSRQSKNYDKAIRYAKKLSQKQTDGHLAYFELGHTYFAQKNLAAARLNAERASNLNDKHVNSLKLLAEIYKQQGERELFLQTTNRLNAL